MPAYPVSKEAPDLCGDVEPNFHHGKFILLRIIFERRCLDCHVYGSCGPTSSDLGKLLFRLASPFVTPQAPIAPRLRGTPLALMWGDSHLPKAQS